jgi:hypothetical protein
MIDDALELDVENDLTILACKRQSGAGFEL